MENELLELADKVLTLSKQFTEAINEAKEKGLTVEFNFFHSSPDPYEMIVEKRIRY